MVSKVEMALAVKLLDYSLHRNMYRQSDPVEIMTVCRLVPVMNLT